MLEVQPTGSKQPPGIEWRRGGWMIFERGFEHSQELFIAALEEFISRGYEQASINTILETASMSKGQFYYHFKNKEGLYLALINVMIAKKVEHLSAVMKPDDFNQGIFEVFKLQIRYSMMFAREYPAISRFSESFIREKGNAIYKKALAIHNFERNDAINALIDQAYRKGEFREDLPLPFIKKTIAYLLTHIADLADLNDAGDFEDNMVNMVKFMKTGLGKAQQDGDKASA